MLFNQFLSGSSLACGLWLAFCCGSVSGQEPSSRTKGIPSARAGSGSSNDRQQNNIPNSPRSPIQGQQGAFTFGSNPPQNVTYSTPNAAGAWMQTPVYNSNPSQAEMMVFEEGEFKVVTQNLNDPQVMEAAREGRRVLAEAVQTLRSESNSEDKRAEAKKVMTQYLEAHFDHDQKKRREQLESLEAQVVKLKAQLDKRSQSKDQLIELRLTLLENDASGLSFPQSWTQMPGVESSPQQGGVYTYRGPLNTDPYLVPGYPVGPNLGPNLVPSQPTAPVPSQPIAPVPSQPIAPVVGR